MELKKEKLAETLQELVRIPSFRDSLKVSGYAKDQLEDSGFDAWSDRDGNLIAEKGRGPGFLLNAHMDTVEAGEGWKHDPFGGEMEKGKVYGRGASDCKAGVAALLRIADVMKKMKLRKRVVFTLTAFEEGYPVEKNGVYRILPKLKDIEKGLVLEPTTKGKTIGIAVGCRGTMRARIEILGKRGHSAYTEISDNPIHMFPAFMRELEKLPRNTMKTDIIHDEIGERITVTEICAREGGNVTPSKCELITDSRLVPSTDPDKAFSELEKACKKSLGNRFRIEKYVANRGYIHEDRDFLSLCRESAEAAGAVPRPFFERARIDGTIFSNFGGIGTFMMGPGDISMAHKPEEHCSVEELHLAARAVLEVTGRSVCS